MPGEAGSVTELLGQWAQGDRAALDVLIPVVYAELRSIAAAYLRRESDGHLFQPTALVHEAWIRLTRRNEPRFVDRKNFFGVSALLMRRILVDHARRVKSAKRSAPSTLGAAIDDSAARADELLALDVALSRLAAVSERQARVVELKYFSGLNSAEIAELLSISSPTVSRDLAAAEAWLCHVMSDRKPASP